MPDITAAMDEAAVNQVLPVAQATLGMVANAGSTQLKQFHVTYNATAWFTGGTAHLFPTDNVQINGCKLNYTTHFTLSFDLSDFIPDIHIPGVKVKVFKKWVVLIPEFNVNWPTVNVPVSHAGSVLFTSNFKVHTVFVNPNWNVNVVIQSVPVLQLTPAASAILALIGVAAAAALGPIPFIGPFLATAVVAITASIGIGGATGLLGLMLTPFVTGTTFTLYSQPKHFPLLPASGPYDPAVFIDLASVNALVVNSGEPELRLLTNVTP